MKLVPSLLMLLLFLPGISNSQELESFHYKENFENRMLGAWASYPHWQDIAYDQNFRVNELLPGDKNISVVQRVTPYTAVDNYAGAQKLMEAVLTPDSKLRFRYFIKTNQQVEELTIRWAADSLGKLDMVIKKPATNQWKWVDMNFTDLVTQNSIIKGKDQVQIHALAFLTKIPNADPAMPIYFSLDDIELTAKQPARFKFEQPAVNKLSEFPALIALQTYHAGKPVNWRGKWQSEAQDVVTEISSYTGKKVLQKINWKKDGASWVLQSPAFKLPVGMYKAHTVIYNRGIVTGTTDMVFRMVPQQQPGHPRLLFDAAGKDKMKTEFQSAEFKPVLDDIVTKAKAEREKIPVAKLVFDLDQFPDEDWLPTWSSWGSRIYHTGEALRLNARAYAFADDQEAGRYVREVLVKLSSWPNWTHPWQTKRGRFSEHRTGSWSHRVAEAYDLVYELIPETERKQIRKALIKNIIDGAHKTYVVDDNITGATSNWLAMTLGGSLMTLAAIVGDEPSTDTLETEIAGAIFKLDKFLNRVVDSVDGAWGEGLGYNNYSMSNLAYSLPSMERVFGVDLSAPVRKSFNEFVWGGIVQKKEWFEYGDSGGEMGVASNWAYLLQKYRDPRLAWYYNFLKKNTTYEEVLYDLKGIPQKSAFEENPVKVFRDIGTTVFKSGWDSTDMVFVMRTGPFYNHQHLDQGSFWFADRGDVFMEERHLHNSNYYDDPIYQSHLIQPIAHSTILIDSNAQSQRVGDHRNFAKGFTDYAYLAAFVDGKNAAFSSGDIGRLYWGKVKSLRRNVLYLKPRVILMMDVAVPAEKNVSVDLIYQTGKLSAIQPGDQISSIKGQHSTLSIQHLNPSSVQSRAIETPHYLKTLNSPVPMEREGMLKVSAVTAGGPLVIANLLSTLPSDSISTQDHAGMVTGMVGINKFMVNKHPGKQIHFEGITTDALCMSWSAGSIVFGQVKQFTTTGFSFESSEELAVETDGKSFINYSAESPAELTVVIGKGKTRRYKLAAGQHRLSIK